MSQTASALLSRVSEASNPYSKAQCTLFEERVDDFVETVRLLYGAAPECAALEQLRSQILRAVAPMVAKYLRQAEALEELVGSMPRFAMELIEVLGQLAEQEVRGEEGSVKSGRGSWSSGSERGASEENGGRRKVYIPMNEDSEDEME